MYLATVGPALPMSLPNPYQRIPIAIGRAVRPPRTGGSTRRINEGLGGLTRDEDGPGAQASFDFLAGSFSDAVLGSSLGWEGVSSDITTVHSGKTSTSQDND